MTAQTSPDERQRASRTDGLDPTGAGTVYLALAVASVLVLLAVLARLPLVSEPSPFARAAVVVASGVTAAVRTTSRLVEDRR